MAAAVLTYLLVGFFIGAFHIMYISEAKSYSYAYSLWAKLRIGICSLFWPLFLAANAIYWPVYAIKAGIHSFVEDKDDFFRYAAEDIPWLDPERKNEKQRYLEQERSNELAASHSRINQLERGMESELTVWDDCHCNHCRDPHPAW